MTTTNNPILIRVVREGARIVKEGNRVLINAACAVEFLNPRRAIPPLATNKELQLRTEVMYRVHTGLLISGCTNMPLRPTMEVFQPSGMLIHRVDELDGELVIYLSVLAPCRISQNAPFFESFALSAFDLDVQQGREAATSSVAVDPGTISQEPVAKSAGGIGRELTDDEKRQKFDAMLDSEPTDPNQQTLPGGPAVNKPVVVHEGFRRVGST
jgi:hypothetical protein